MLDEGAWWLKSISDPRWNCEGHGLVGMFSMPSAAKKKIEEMKEKLKCEPPEDLEFGYMKD